MTKIVNLDKLDTRKEKIVILNGKEHIMRSLTVREYIAQMKASEEISKLSDESDLSAASRIFEITVEALHKVFPTIPLDELENLSMDQLTALKDLADDNATEEVADKEGEAKGKDQA